MQIDSELEFPEPCKKEDAIIPMPFTIENIEYITKQITGDNGIFGPGSRSWISGTSSVVNIDVKPSKEIPVKKLVFKGYSNVQIGDKIRAYINCYTEREGRSTGQVLGGREICETLYFFREPKETEEISKLEKLDEKGNVLATFGLEDLI